MSHTTHYLEGSAMALAMTLFGASAACAMPGGGQAASQPAARPATPDAVSPAPAAQPDSAGESPDIVVTGSRRPRGGTGSPVAAGAYELTKDDWSDVLAGTSALALVKNLPGVTFTSTDAYGLDLSDGFLLVRGFRQNEVAITFEGIPLNDGSYGSVTGTAPLNIGVTSTIGAVRIAPGAAAVDTFSNTVAGGEIRYTLVDPKARAGGTFTQGIGSNATFVSSAAVHTGELGGGGPRLLVGAERISKDKYTGAGTQSIVRANAKAVQELPWGDVTTFFSYTNAKIWGYNNTSFDMLDKLGWNGTDIVYPDYARAIYINLPENANKPCGAYTCGELAALTPYDTGQRTTDYVGNLAHHFRLSDALSGSVMGYAAASTSDIEISDISTPSQTGAPFSSLVWATRPQRFGGTADLKLVAGRHTVSAGLWIERGTATSRFANYNQPLPGQGAPIRAIGPYDRYGPAFRITNDSRWRTDSTQIFLQDVFRPVDELTITAGVKAVAFVTSGGGIGPDRAPNGTLRARDPFLPHLAVDWRPDGRNALYLDLAKTTVGYRVSSRGNIGPVSSAWAADTQALFEAAAPNLKPEENWNLTVGGFHSFGMVTVNLDGYYGIIRNRLLNGASGPQFDPVRSVGIVRRSTLVGADLIVDVKPVRGLDISQSVSVSKLRYGSDLDITGDVVPLNGHYQPGYPGMSLVTQASAQQGRWEAGATSTVYLDNPFTYTNDIYLPTYWQTNAHVTYHLDRHGRVPDLVFRLDANNLFDRRNIGSAGIGGYSVTGDYQTFMRSAPRQFLLTATAAL